MPASVPDGVREALGNGWIVEVVAAAVSSRGDGGSVSAEAVAAVRGAEIYIGAGVPADVLVSGSENPALLRWAHTTTAGVSSFLYPEMLASPVVLTNSAGIHAPPMAESVLGMILHFARGFDFALASQRVAEWEQDAFTRADSPVREIAGSVLGIIGMGGIGSEVAIRGEALGMRVIATRSSSTRVELEQLLRSSDFVAVCVPDTPGTRGLIGARELALMKPGAVLISVSRGSVVDESALCTALQESSLRGAGMDVFEREPLPPESALWRLPNVLITPHVSAVTHRFWDRQLELITDNIARYLAGEPLRNVVDKMRGY